jgi:hypothetical protein
MTWAVDQPLADKIDHTATARSWMCCKHLSSDEAWMGKARQARWTGCNFLCLQLAQFSVHSMPARSQ